MTDRPLIEVSIPDYDTRFTYSLKLGELAAFSDNNKLELADRAQLTDLVSIVNAWIIRFSQLERAAMQAVAILDQPVQHSNSRTANAIQILRADAEIARIILRKAIS